MGFTIKNQEAIRDYGYIELAIDFGRRITAEQVFAFVEELRDKVESQAGIDYVVTLKTIGIEHPENQL